MNGSVAGSSSATTTPTPSATPGGDANANGGGKFGPKAPCTRAQMVTLLYRAYGNK